MSEEQGVRVDPVTEQAPDEREGYSSMLNENLELLRKLETMHGEVLSAQKEVKAALQAQHTAEKDLQTFKEAHRVPGGFRGMHRKLLWLNITLATMTILAGPYLWLRWHVDPNVNYILILGVVWMIVCGFWSFAMADNER